MVQCLRHTFSFIHSPGNKQYCTVKTFSVPNVRYNIACLLTVMIKCSDIRNTAKSPFLFDPLLMFLLLFYAYNTSMHARTCPPASSFWPLHRQTNGADQIICLRSKRVHNNVRNFSLVADDEISQFILPQSAAHSTFCLQNLFDILLLKSLQKLKSVLMLIISLLFQLT